MTVGKLVAGGGTTEMVTADCWKDLETGKLRADKLGKMWFTGSVTIGLGRGWAIVGAEAILTEGQGSCKVLALFENKPVATELVAVKLVWPGKRGSWPGKPANVLVGWFSDSGAVPVVFSG